MKSQNQEKSTKFPESQDTNLSFSYLLAIDCQDSRNSRMDDLHSIACSNNRLQSSVWDFHDLDVFNADISQFLENTPPFVSSFETDYSTGYLQDALFTFSSKRRRLLLFDDSDNLEYPTKDYSENYDHFNQGISISSCDTMSGESLGASMTRIEEDSYPLMSRRTPEESFSAPEVLIEYSSSSSNQKDSICNHSINDNKELVPCMDPFLSSSDNNGDERRKKRILSTQVAYPFAVIKPGGYEGDVTLNEINEKILMPPTRPVRHPVGDFACRPLVVSPDGPGLSGKAVVALRRIQTQGRGTITIIRTRG
ncbi:hypothetical protein LIER_19755 [Lithospermum erythrorhizon]|uniref:Protein XRI1 n=1 Tax=Lithospermum erythrorhizon TaxID=34254 RepID=A0AAV3QL86_LITER